MLMDTGDATATVDVALVRREGDMGTMQEGTPTSQLSDGESTRHGGRNHCRDCRFVYDAR
jgi:hypothetical protein